MCGRDSRRSMIARSMASLSGRRLVEVDVDAVGSEDAERVLVAVASDRHQSRLMSARILFEEQVTVLQQLAQRGTGQAFLRFDNGRLRAVPPEHVNPLLREPRRVVLDLHKV